VGFVACASISAQTARQAGLHGDKSSLPLRTTPSASTHRSSAREDGDAGGATKSGAGGCHQRTKGPSLSSTETCRGATALSESRRHSLSDVVVVDKIQKVSLGEGLPGPE